MQRLASSGETPGPKARPWKAAMAVGHSILVAAWHILAHDIDYNDLGADWFARNVNDDHRRDQAIRNLHDLGYRVTLDKVA